MKYLLVLFCPRMHLGGFHAISLNIAALKSRIADSYFSAWPLFYCKVIALKSRTLLLKSRKTFATTFVRDLDAEVALVGDGVRARLGRSDAQRSCD